MTKHPDILNELREIAPILTKECCYLSPYRVPDGYFHQLPTSLFNLIQQAPLTNSNNLQAFQVPAGYFEDFPARMLELVHSVDFAQQASTESSGKFLEQISKKMPYAVPDDYFSGLASVVNDGTQAIDQVMHTLEKPAGLLEQLRNLPTYEVPTGYFDQLTDRLAPVMETKVVQLNFRKKMIQWAAAAIITGLIFAAGWMFKDTPVNSSPEGAAMASVKIPSTITDEEIQQYLEKDPASFVVLDTVTVTASVQNHWDAVEMKEMLADVSDEELEQYASKNATLLNE